MSEDPTPDWSQCMGKQSWELVRETRILLIIYFEHLDPVFLKQYILKGSVSQANLLSHLSHFELRFCHLYRMFPLLLWSTFTIDFQYQKSQTRFKKYDKSRIVSYSRKQLMERAFHIERIVWSRVNSWSVFTEHLLSMSQELLQALEIQELMKSTVCICGSYTDWNKIKITTKI